MKKYFILLLLITAFCGTGHAQLYLTRNGFIGFYSKTAFEDIKAENDQVYAVLDAGKKNIAFTLLLRGFVFPKALMQEHFNENYVESDKYPKATFTGAYTGDIDLTKDGVYPVKIKGNLTLHNVTRPVEVPGTIEVKGGNLIGLSEFKLRPEDFNITIPSVVRDKIEKEMKVNVKIECNKK